MSGDQAEIQQLTQEMNGLHARVRRLKASEREEQAQMTALARAMYAEPSSALLSVLEAPTLGSYLTQNASLDDAAQRAHVLTGQLESNRRQVQASESALNQKRNQVTADQQQARTSQAQLQALATQLHSQQAELESETSTTQSAITTAEQAARQEGAALTSQATAVLSELGTGGLDEQTLNAGLASGILTLSTSSIKWPAQPAPSPLGLAAYPGYCLFTPIQCTCYAANAYQAFTGGTLPQNLGNGGQWISGAQAAGIPTSETPSEGSVVVFSGPGYSVYGHVALVRSVIFSGGTAIGLVVWERNFDDAGDFDVRLVALGSGSEIVGYIPPGL